MDASTNPEGMKGKAGAMRNAHLGGLGREGDRPYQRNRNSATREGNLGWFVG